jgi:peptidoglycan/LPS O-acetylase OafA/YrhL
MRGICILWVASMLAGCATRSSEIAAVSASQTNTRGRFVALDGLRGLAALLVVVFHVVTYQVAPTHLTDNKFVRNGYLAVDLFFLLSGFIMFHNYADNIVNFDRFKRFMLLRFFRVYPLHLAVLLTLVCMELARLAVQGVLHHPSRPLFTTDYSAFLPNILLVHGLHTLGRNSWNAPSWSISCEFFAYTVFGILALARITHLWLFSVAATLVAGGIYCMLAVDFGTLDITYDWGGARCIAGFFLGSSTIFIGSFLPRIVPDRILRIAETAVIVAAIALMSVVTGRAVILVIPLFVVAIALLQTDKGPVARLLQHQSIQYLGRISYSIYMVHLLIILITINTIALFSKITRSTGPMISSWKGDCFLIGIIISVLLVATITYKVIETPGRGLGRRVAAPRSPERDQLPEDPARAVSPGVAGAEHASDAAGSRR